MAISGYPKQKDSFNFTGLAACSAKEVPSFLSHFKTLSNGPAPGIEPATSRSAVKRSTDWANPATVKSKSN